MSDPPKLKVAISYPPTVRGCVAQLPALHNDLHFHDSCTSALAEVQPSTASHDETTCQYPVNKDLTLPTIIALNVIYNVVILFCSLQTRIHLRITYLD